MQQVLTLKLPVGTSLEDGNALEAEIKKIAQVNAAGLQHNRGVDGASMAIWLTLLNPAMDVVKEIIHAIQGKGLTGIEIQLPNNGGTVKVDSASPADLEKLLKAVRQAS